MNKEIKRQSVRRLVSCGPKHKLRQEIWGVEGGSGGGVTAETLEVAHVPVFNNYKGSAVRGDKRFELRLMDLKQI